LRKDQGVIVQRILGELPKAYEETGDPFSNQIVVCLKGPISPEAPPDMVKILDDAVRVLTHYMFFKAKNKELFGTLADLDAAIGEERFCDRFSKLEPPALDLARTYWTFRKVMNDILEGHGEIFLLGVLGLVEEGFSKSIFCDPEYCSDDLSEREKKVKTAVSLHAKEWDPEEFWRTCPKTDQEVYFGALEFARFMGLTSRTYTQCKACEGEFLISAISALDPDTGRCPRCLRLGKPPRPKKWYNIWG